MINTQLLLSTVLHSNVNCGCWIVMCERQHWQFGYFLMPHTYRLTNSNFGSVIMAAAATTSSTTMVMLIRCGRDGLQCVNDWVTIRRRQTSSIATQSFIYLLLHFIITLQWSFITIIIVLWIAFVFSIYSFYMPLSVCLLSHNGKCYGIQVLAIHVVQLALQMYTSRIHTYARIPRHRQTDP